jgi:hypothetical protein
LIENRPFLEETASFRLADGTDCRILTSDPLGSDAFRLADDAVAVAAGSVSRANDAVGLAGSTVQVADGAVIVGNEIVCVADDAVTGAGDAGGFRTDAVGGAAGNVFERVAFVFSSNVPGALGCVGCNRALRFS